MAFVNLPSPKNYLHCTSRLVCYITHIGIAIPVLHYIVKQIRLHSALQICCCHWIRNTGYPPHMSVCAPVFSEETPVGELPSEREFSGVWAQRTTLVDEPPNCVWGV
ncbi:hypothetical protein A0H81_02178 [Grifola frondosa]|uniref:Uncharacterized protein n=1 Tax=Grifola frondosa TaxID=5627 RepID=A0A1C7MLQ5_GRIFR|nr:hypothetical protein A0H81_02178 [Grifola frondosa]